MHRRSYIPGSDNKAGRPTHPEAPTANIHRGTAARMFNVREQDVTEEQVKAAKKANFAAVYGGGGGRSMARTRTLTGRMPSEPEIQQLSRPMAHARSVPPTRKGFGGFVDKLKQVLNAPVTLPFARGRKGKGGV